MRGKYLAVLTILMGAFLWLTPVVKAQAKAKSAAVHTPAPNATCAAGMMNCVTNADRKAAAARAAAIRTARQPQVAAQVLQVRRNATSIPVQPGCALPVMNPGGMPDYMSGCVGNYANSPLPITDPATGAYVSGGMRKFIDPLPNIPVAHPDTVTYPGSDYYEIALVQYEQQMHSDLPSKTLLRGYVQLNNGTDAQGQNTIAPAPVRYLGPIIAAQRNRPVRIKFINQLPATGAKDALGQDGALFIPVDTTIMGSGMGPGGSMYSQNRANLHLHGGNTPWISDGTPHQWTTPADENTSYPKGVSVRDVPDMPPAAPGEMTFFYTNQQSARLMFYHDHAYGITRLNVYAGEAAGYLIQDPVEQTLVHGGTITPPTGTPVTVPPGTVPADEIPLIIQDKTFLPSMDQLAAQDPTWNWGRTDSNGNFTSGDLWFPHVYMPNQNPSDLSGANAMGRWDWGPWFWPPMDPSTLQKGEVDCPTPFNPAQKCPGTPNPSLTPEAFVDTPIVNGTAYPYIEVQPKAYRLRILNAANDRSFNLSLYQAVDSTGLLPSDGSGVFYPDPNNPSPACTSPSATTPPAGTPQTCTEVKFTNATDGIVSQGPIPDPATKGPNMIQIGTEGGLLPAPVTLTNTPIGYNYNRRDIVVLNVNRHNLLLGPAERADVIVDFSQYAGKTLILYNDSPAPMPAFDTRYDYYTGDADQTAMGGAPSTLPGFGPNTRTIMQIRVAGGSNAPFDPAPLNTALPAAFAASQHPPIVPESAFNPVYGTNNPDIYSRIQDTGLIAGVKVLNGGSGYTAPTVSIAGGGGSGAAAYATVSGGVITGITLTSAGAGYTSQPSITISDTTGTGATASVTFYPILRKTIQELFELDYGRMNATLGVEMPLTNFNTQTTIPLGYIDPPTESFKDGETQIWKVTHNGVDTHAIHFHLFDVQVINRVGWDGAIRPPEPDEVGWKDTVRMSPLEDVIVAIRPNHQNLPFPVPDNIRLLDVTANQGDSLRIFNPADGNRITGTGARNDYVNFGAEYVWHCHLLGHEENDMMRPMIYQIPPEPPQTLTATAGTGTHGLLTWLDTSATETAFEVQRDSDPSFPNPTLLAAAPASSVQNLKGQGTDFGSTISFTDPSADCTGSPCYYRVRAVNTQAFNGYDATGALKAPQTLYSFWSNIAAIGAVPGSTVTPTSLAFGSQIVNSTSAAQVITITNTAAAPASLAVSNISIAGANPADFSQTNTCGNSIAAGDSCTISVTFTPSGFGARSASLSFTLSDPANTAPTVNLTGSGDAPVLSVSPAAVSFGAQQVLTTSSPAKTVTISNTGTQTLSITSVGVGGANASDFGFTQNCGTTFPIALAAGASCTANVTFTPAASGLRAASFDVAVGSPAQPQSVALTGTGNSPGAVLSPASLSFASQLVNTTSAAQNVVLTNNGQAPLTITSVAFTGANAADFAASTCASPLPVNGSCTIGVTFTPTARGSRSATLVVTDNAPSGTQTVAVSGTGIAPVASVFPPAINFGTQVNAVASAPQTVIISNSGDASLLINNISIGGANASEFALNIGSCGIPVPALNICSVSVVFTPASSGAKAATLTIASSDPVNPVLSVPLAGTGTAVSLSPADIAFGNQAVGTPSTGHTVTITNNGPVALAISSIALTGTDATQFTLNSACGTNLNVGRSCNVTVRFAPQSVGAKSASLTYTTSDVGQPTASVGLSGTGTAPALTAAPMALTFSSPVYTTSAPQPVTVTNTGTAPLTITSITLGGTNIGQFRETDNCAMGAPIAVGAGCTINVTFRPRTTTPTTMSQILNINVAAPANSVSIPLTGTVVVPTYSTTPSAIAFGPQAINTTSTAQTITLTNTGTVALPISNIALGGTNANQFRQTNTCGANAFRPFPSTLAVGASCTISVTFRPTTATSSTATITVSAGGGATPAQTVVNLTGTGQ